MKVLIADDDGMVRAYLRDVLVEAGCSVVEAIDGEAAVAAFSTERPDAVFLDLLMPKLNGYEAMRAIRLKKPGVRVALLTALSDRTAARLGNKSEPDAYLAKPFKPEDVERALRTLVPAGS